MHVTVLKLGEGSHAVPFSVHHIALGDMSTVSMVGQIVRLYDVFRFGPQADVASRAHAAFDDVIGYLVNLVPLRCSYDCLGSDVTFESVLTSVSAGVLTAMEHGRAPLDGVTQAAGADPGDKSRFTVVVNYIPPSLALCRRSAVGLN